MESASAAREALNLREDGTRLEIQYPWVSRTKRVVLIAVFAIFFSMWIWSELSRAHDNPAVILVPLPIFLFLGYGLAAIAFGSTRLRIEPGRIAWEYGGVPLLPSRSVLREEIDHLSYWQQTVPTRHGSYTTGVVGLLRKDRVQLAILDTFRDIDEARRMADRIAHWMNRNPDGVPRQAIEVRHSPALTGRRDWTYLRRIILVAGTFCALLLLTALASEYYKI